MKLDDLLYFNTCNLDKMTETYHLGFYLEYLSKWPELCRVVVDFPGGHQRQRGSKKGASNIGGREERIVGYGESPSKTLRCLGGSGPTLSSNSLQVHC